MLNDNKKQEKADDENLSYEERSKLLWSLRSEFAWTGKKVPENVEIDGQEYKLKVKVQELLDKDSLDANEVTEIKLLIPKLQEKAKINEELLETEELTKAEGEALYEEATGLLRAAIELEDRLKGKSGEKGAEEFKKMLNTQKLMDEKGFQQLLKDLK
jgi:hypothetical protein